mgnify:CR=1 FL=1
MSTGRKSARLKDKDTLNYKDIALGKKSKPNNSSISRSKKMSDKDKKKPETVEETKEPAEEAKKPSDKQEEESEEDKKDEASGDTGSTPEGEKVSQFHTDAMKKLRDKLQKAEQERLKLLEQEQELALKKQVEALLRDNESIRKKISTTSTRSSDLSAGSKSKKGEKTVKEKGKSKTGKSKDQAQELQKELNAIARLSKSKLFQSQESLVLMEDSSDEESSAEEVSSSEEADTPPSKRPGKKHTISSKSGLRAKASNRVRFPQIWAHTALQLEFISSELEFASLNFPELVAGELEICTSPGTNREEQAGRLRVLKRLAYLKSSQVTNDTIKDIYAAIFRRIELGLANWSSDFSDIVNNMMVSRANRARANTKQGTGSNSSSQQKWANRKQQTWSQKESQMSGRETQPQSSGLSVFFCKDYQRNRCSQPESEHRAHVRGQEVQVLHICASCYLKDRVLNYHPESSSICPHYNEL